MGLYSVEAAGLPKGEGALSCTRELRTAGDGDACAGDE